LLPAQAASSAAENDIATMRIMMELGIDARAMRTNLDGFGAIMVPNLEKGVASLHGSPLRRTLVSISIYVGSMEIDFD
jgi:hypothetical protein